jgi:hypothetical protein
MSQPPLHLLVLKCLTDLCFGPGMPVEVYIETEERTVISYLAKPFIDQAMKGFREE